MSGSRNCHLICHNLYKKADPIGSKTSDHSDAVLNSEQTEILVIRTLQHKMFQRIIKVLMNYFQKDSRSRKLPPYLDKNKIVRVGGRLENVDLAQEHLNLILMPRHHLREFLVKRFMKRLYIRGSDLHRRSHPQCGFWILDYKRRLSSCIHQYPNCHRLHGKLAYQKMSDLP